MDRNIFSSGLISKDEFEREKANAIRLSDNDIIWSLFNKKLLSCMKEGSWQEMKMIYYEMAIFLNKEGKEFLHLLRESRKCELMDYKDAGVDKVKILTAGINNSCKECLQLEGKGFDIDDALNTMPIPVKGCKTDVFGTGKGFCRCIYSPVILTME